MLYHTSWCYIILASHRPQRLRLLGHHYLSASPQLGEPLLPPHPFLPPISPPHQPTQAKTRVVEISCGQIWLEWVVVVVEAVVVESSVAAVTIITTTTTWGTTLPPLVHRALTIAHYRPLSLLLPQLHTRVVLTLQTQVVSQPLVIISIMIIIQFVQRKF